MTHPNIDTITHSLTGTQVAEALMKAFDGGIEQMYILSNNVDIYQMPSILRVGMARIWNQRGIDKMDRYGIRSSDPFPWSLDNGLQMKCMAIIVTKYDSPAKALTRAMSTVKMGDLHV